MTSKLRNAPSNWFLTWDQHSSNQQKAFLLQVKLQDLSNRHVFTDVINSFVVIYRRFPSQRNWHEIGRTALILDDPNPQYPEAFRVCYEYQTDLSADMLKLVCLTRRDILTKNEDVIGTANVSVRELLRTFGTRVQVELVRKRTNKIAGSVWFLGEPLPTTSPRGGSDVFQFSISLLSLRPSRISHHAPHLLLLVERQREDSTWSVVYRSNVVKRPKVAAVIVRNRPTVFKPFQIRQSELVVGMSLLRKIRFSFFQKGKRGDPHTCVGQVMTSTDELINDFLDDTSLDLRMNDEVVGEFACVSRKAIDKITILDIHVDYFDIAKEVRKIGDSIRNNTIDLDRA